MVKYSQSGETHAERFALRAIARSFVLRCAVSPDAKRASDRAIAFSGETAMYYVYLIEQEDTGYVKSGNAIRIA